VKAKTVSFEKLQRDKRRARLRDERRLARGEVTPEQLQEENSLVPMGATITIVNLCETLERYYGK
jgi:transcription elongation GreA/GreB family factor